MYLPVNQDANGTIYTKRVATSKRIESRLYALQDRTLRIEEVEKIEGGFFSSAYYLFLVRVGMENEAVKRRSTDFIWLRESLIKEFPLSYIPPISLVENRATDCDYIQEQRLDFELFLQEIINNEELMNSEALEAFLFLSQSNEYIEAKKKIDLEFGKRSDFKTSVSRKTAEFYPKDSLDFEQVKTSVGHVAHTLIEVDLKISNSLKDFYDLYNETSDGTMSLIGQLTGLSKSLHDSLKKTESIYDEMSRVCSLLHQRSTEFTQENTNSENEVFGRIFFSLQNMFLLQGEAQKREATIARQNLQATFGQWEKELFALEDVN